MKIATFTLVCGSVRNTLHSKTGKKDPDEVYKNITILRSLDTNTKKKLTG